MSKVQAIGIDLGTTYSCVAAFCEDNYEIVKTENGSPTMASFVSFTNYGRIIGNEAKENSVIYATSTIFDVKRIIGRSYDDEILKTNIKNFPFEVVNVNGTPKIKIQNKGRLELFYPEEISAMILEKLKENAERQLKTEIYEAVITVPAHFNDAQRQATKDAGKLAGLQVLRIINEPTAAALAYGLDKKYKEHNEVCNALVYDFGGGTFDVSIIAIDSGIFEVKATDGDTNLGGDDIDLCLLNHFANIFQNKYKKDLRTDRRAVRRLRIKCEKLKIQLSSASFGVIDIDNLFEENDFYSMLNRSDFESMCLPIFEKTLNYVRQALNEAKMKVEEIHEILLVGGSTRIPKVQELLTQLFGGRELNTSLNPDEAVAIGASVEAAILSGTNSDIVGGLLLLDVNPLSLGIKVIGERMSTIIPRNTQTPVKLMQNYYTVCDNQTVISICVYEGERKDVKYNHLMGKFNVEGLTPRPAGQTSISVTLNLDTNGILQVTATEIEEGKENSKTVNINYEKSRLSDSEIENIIKQAAKFKEEDAKWAKNVEARLKFEEYCNRTKKRIDDFSGVISEQHRKIIEAQCNSSLQWISENMNKPKEEYDMKEKEVYAICNPIIRHYL